MQLDREGRFKAKPYEWMVKEVNDKPMFEVYYRITQMLVDGQWEDWSQYDMTQQAAYWLFKSDGSVNNHAHKCLQECFGWSGRALEDLDSNDWSQVEVQLTCAFETYNNKEKLVAKYTNPGDSVPSTRVSAEKLKSMDATWGAKLRAAAGPAKPPSKPAPAKGPEPLRGPAAPKTYKPPPAEPNKNGECSDQVAWDFFCDEFKAAFPSGSEEEMNKTWHTVIRDIVKGKEPEAFDNHDWGKVKAECGKKLVLSVEPSASEIPF